MSRSSTDDGSKRVDPRVLRTRALLRAAVLELAAEREPGSITIAHVAERATINRATVYQHYRDRDELLLDAMENELAGLVDLVARCPLVVLPEAMPLTFVAIFRHVEANTVLYQRMLGPCGSARFINRLHQLVAGQVTRQLVAAGVGAADAPGVELRAGCAAGAVIGLITQWLRGPGTPRAEAAAADAWQALQAVGGGPAR
ncbi:TetR/AcrR family transcriptional regulator [Kitasatospora sp. NPDC052896]|uniref:TetR/AcrR family transcriptional regulator n=1 Tax=Kitasatospora sp. NPDC052896 TaxID=3364061 RepID=UPI0037C62BD0